MTRNWTIVLIVTVSYAISFAISPADPISHYMEWIVVSAVGLCGYWLGRRSQKKNERIECSDELKTE